LCQSHTSVALLDCLVRVTHMPQSEGVVTVASHAQVRPIVGNLGVVHRRAIECKTLLKALAGDGQSPIKNGVLPHAHVKPARHVIARQARRQFV
jgi:hypothetical protein